MHSSDSRPVPAAHALDWEILRAQMVNALNQALHFLLGANPGLQANIVLGKVADMHIAFQVKTNQGEPRTYGFVLKNPDGSQAHLSRHAPNGELMPLDEFDQAFAQAVSASLGATVALAYEYMLPRVARPTHSSPPLLQ